MEKSKQHKYKKPSTEQKNDASDTNKKSGDGLDRDSVNSSTKKDNTGSKKLSPEEREERLERLGISKRQRAERENIKRAQRNIPEVEDEESFNEGNEVTKDDKFEKIRKESLIDLTKDVPKAPAVIEVEDRIWGTSDGISVIMGKAKSKKTFLVASVVASVIGKKPIFNKIHSNPIVNKKKVLWFDTEQGRWGVQNIARKALIMAEQSNDIKHFEVLALRKYTPDVRLKYIEWEIKRQSSDIGVVVIDGVRDILFDINQSKEAIEVVTKMMQWTEENNIHIIVILHANKTDGNLRGHIGTELLNKAESVIKVEADPKDKDIAIVSNELSRYRLFEDFAFSIDENGIPTEADVIEFNNKHGAPEIKFDDHLELHEKVIEQAFELQDSYAMMDFREKIRSLLLQELDKIGISKVKEWIDIYENNGWILVTNVKTSKVVTRP